MCYKTCYLLKWIHIISIETERRQVNLTCDLSGSNITWSYEGQRTCYIGHVLTLESIMRNASGVYRCNDSTSGENYTVTVECE